MIQKICQSQQTSKPGEEEKELVNDIIRKLFNESPPVFVEQPLVWGMLCWTKSLKKGLKKGSKKKNFTQKSPQKREFTQKKSDFTEKFAQKESSLKKSAQKIKFTPKS